MHSLTPRQQQILSFIQHIQSQTGSPPTRAEICAEFSFRSPTAAEDHLRALQKKGAIQLLSGKSRGIRILNQDPPFGLPVIGQVAAGAPILAEQHIEDHYEIQPLRFHPKADYLLRVRGHSMKEVGIFDRDLLAVHSTQVAHNGQIVVARVEDEVTVKRFFRHGDKVILQPENTDFTDIEVDLSCTDFAIEGLGVGVIRDQGV